MKKSKLLALVLSMVVIGAMMIVGVSAADPAAKIDDTPYPTLQDAIDAIDDVAGTHTITLLANCAENVEVPQNAGVYITIDGANKTYTGTITVNGQSRTDDDKALTIKNINFDAKSITEYDACIRLGDNTSTATKNAKRYIKHLTVQDCTFVNGGSKVVAVKSYTGGDKYVTIKNCVSTNMHSLMQLSNVEVDLVIDGCTITGKSGIGLGQSYDATVTNCVIDVAEYGIRSDANKLSEVNIENNNITAYIPVVVRYFKEAEDITADEAYELEVVGNTLKATNTDGLACAIGNKEYSKDVSIDEIEAPSNNVNVIETLDFTVDGKSFNYPVGSSVEVSSFAGFFTKAGYEIEGLYTDETLITQADVNGVLEINAANATLYIKWVPTAETQKQMKFVAVYGIVLTMIMPEYDIEIADVDGVTVNYNGKMTPGEDKFAFCDSWSADWTVDEGYTLNKVIINGVEVDADGIAIKWNDTDVTIEFDVTAPVVEEEVVEEEVTEEVTEEVAA